MPDPIGSSSSSQDCILTCDQCPAGMARIWTLVVTGVTSEGGCCDGYNGTFTLRSNDVTPCVWTADEIAPLCASGTGNPWFMSYDSGSDRWLLENIMVDTLHAKYAIDADDWNCNGPNEFTYDSGGTSFCGDWPETLTVTPTNCGAGSSSSGDCEAVCLYLSAEEVAEIVASGGTIVGGPFSSEVECQANCCNNSSSSSNSSGFAVVETTNCCCPIMAEKWTFTLSGITNANCSNCTSLNGTWTVVFQPPPLSLGCSWLQNTGVSCPGVGDLFIFGKVGSNMLLAGYNHSYSLPCDSFDCVGPNVLIDQGNGGLGLCDGWPPTLTITPA